MKKRTIIIPESKLHAIVKKSINKIINENYYYGNNILNEPIEISSEMWLVQVKFNNDGSGECYLSFDYNENDSDSFWLDFEIDTNRLDVLLNTKYVGDRVSINSNEAARCVRFTLNHGYVTNNPQVDLNLKREIVKLYRENFNV